MRKGWILGLAIMVVGCLMGGEDGESSKYNGNFRSSNDSIFLNISGSKWKSTIRHRDGDYDLSGATGKITITENINVVGVDSVLIHSETVQLVLSSLVLKAAGQTIPKENSLAQSLFRFTIKNGGTDSAVVNSFVQFTNTRVINKPAEPKYNGIHFLAKDMVKTD